MKAPTLITFRVGNNSSFGSQENRLVVEYHCHKFLYHANKPVEMPVVRPKDAPEAA